MQAFELSEFDGDSTSPYREIVRAPSLSVGLYVLPVGGVDRQTPHTEDEVYHVVAGMAQIQVGDEHRQVRSGTVVFVAAGIEHRFHSITEELKVLVFFAPAEYSLR